MRISTVKGSGLLDCARAAMGMMDESAASSSERRFLLMGSTVRHGVAAACILLVAVTAAAAPPPPTQAASAPRNRPDPALWVRRNIDLIRKASTRKIDPNESGGIGSTLMFSL